MPNAMILLEPGHRSLGETCEFLLVREPSDPRDPTTIKLWDFDSVSYEVHVENRAPFMHVSINIPFWDEIKDFGGQAALEKHYGSAVEDEPQEGFSITLKVVFEDMESEQMARDWSEKLKLLKSNLVGGIFHQYFGALADGKSGSSEPYTFDLRPDTQVFFAPAKDRVVVVFGIDFREKVDQVIAKIFMQELSEARRKVQGAPPVTFTVEPPRELSQFDIKENSGTLGFVSFAILRTHVSTPKKRDQIAITLQGFRTYLQYHIKCSKSYFHSRMRKRVLELLKVLNRAKVKPPGAKAGSKAKKGRRKSKSN